VLACLLYPEELGVAGIARLGNREKVHLRTTTMQEPLGRLMELIPSNKYLHARYVSLQHLRLHLVDVHCASKCPFTIGLICSLAYTSTLVHYLCHTTYYILPIYHIKLSSRHKKIVRIGIKHLLLEYRRLALWRLNI
jgi:hypothetical protein